MEKRKFYVCVNTGEIAEHETGNNAQFTVYGEPEDIIELREYLDEMHDANYSAFWRAHIPLKEYHHDEPNDEYDEMLLRTYKKLYQIGDQKTQQFISELPFFDALMQDDSK